MNHNPKIDGFKRPVSLFVTFHSASLIKKEGKTCPRYWLAFLANIPVMVYNLFEKRKVHQNCKYPKISPLFLVFEIVF